MLYQLETLNDVERALETCDLYLFLITFPTAESRVSYK